jgi:hypothetical protein
VTWNEPGEQMQKLLLNEMESGRVKNKKPANTNRKRTCVCVLNQSETLLSFSHKAQSAARVAKIEHRELPKSTNNPRANIRV